MVVAEQLENLSLVVVWLVGILTDIMMLFLEMPLVIFTGAAVVGIGFKLVGRFFRAKR